MSDPTGGASSVSLDELESQQEEKPDYTQLKLDGEDIPEILRGKSISEVVQRFGSIEEALRTSENARLSAERQAELALRGAPAPKAPEPEPVQELTKEQLLELHETDPLAAIEYMNQRAIRNAEKNLEARLGPLVSGTAASVEAAARAKYAEEFEVLGDEISKFAETIPNKQQVLSNPQAWDDLVSLVRGRSGNFEKMIEHRAAKNGGGTRAAAQEMEIQSVGFTGTPAVRSPAPRNAGNLDPIQAEIAEKLGMTPAEYQKWSKVS